MDLMLHIGTSLQFLRWRNTFQVGYRTMDLMLQFGFGMMEHCKVLISAWGQGTAILSPRDLNHKQLEKLAKAIRALPGGQLWIDPQLYLPHSDHERLRSHDYWPADYSTGLFWEGPPLHKMLTKLHNLNIQLGAESWILPGRLCAQVDELWVSNQAQTAEYASEFNSTLPLFSTIALAADVVRDSDQMEKVQDAAVSWDTSGYYIVLEHPRGNYYVEDPVWIANALDLATFLKLRNKSVVFGYCNHQMLIAGCAKVDAVASGTWMNVRCFPPEKFRAAVEDEEKQRSIWYYCPQALCEYKIPFLDLAHSQGILDQLRPPQDMRTPYSDILFQGPRPSTIGFPEQFAFRHYLHCLMTQATKGVLNSFEETIAFHREVITQAISLMGSFEGFGIRGAQRNFLSAAEASIGGLKAFENAWGSRLKRSWNEIHKP